jgi:hypothetical protein
VRAALLGIVEEGEGELGGLEQAAAVRESGALLGEA